MDLQLDLWSFCLLLDALRCPAEYKLQKKHEYISPAVPKLISKDELYHNSVTTFFFVRKHIYTVVDISGPLVHM